MDTVRSAELNDHFTTVIVLDRDQPDVALIVGPSEPLDSALQMATRQADLRGGRLCVMLYVDNGLVREPTELRRRSANARQQLAAIRDRCEAISPALDVVEFLHIGTRESLLHSLESSIGAAVYADQR